MQLLQDLNILEEVFEKFFKKSTLTNSYMLKEGYVKHIEAENLYYDLDEKNAFFYLKKNGFFRLYYFINDSNRLFSFSDKEAIVIEIVHRGSKNFPMEHRAYFEQAGFASHLSRDSYFLKNKNLKKKTLNRTSLIKKAETEKEIHFVKALIDSYLDLYTGDNLSLEEIKNYASQGYIYVSYTKQNLSGFLQSELKNKVFWLGHIVIDPSFRGKGIANELAVYYLNEGIEQKCNQYQLWVIQNNEVAVNLYKKYGFVYLNKSTFSMLKK